jgi:hypothetical protein
MADASRRSDDLKGTGFPDITWDGSQDVQSLEQLRRYVVAQAEEAGNWYIVHRRWKRFWGRAIRLLALLATTVSGIIPVLAQILENSGKPEIQPAWASVALAIAAALVALDYFFGFTSAWMRYMQTQQQIVHVLREFQFDWEAVRAGWGWQPPDQAQVLAALARLKQTALQIQQLVEDETNTWIGEFRTSLRMIDEAARAKLEAPARPGVNVTLTNGSQVAGEWSLRVDDGTPTSQRGGRAALVGLTPGPHKFRAEGTIAGNLMQDEATANVPATGISEVKLTLQ